MYFLRKIGTRLILGFLVIVVIMAAVSLYQVQTSRELSRMQTEGGQRSREMLEIKDVIYRVDEVYPVVASGVINQNFAEVRSQFERIKISAERDIVTIEQLARAVGENDGAAAFAEQYKTYLTSFDKELLPLLEQSESTRNRFSDALIIANIVGHVNEIHTMLFDAIIHRKNPEFAFSGTTSYDAAASGFEKLRIVAEGDIDNLRKITAAAEKDWAEVFILKFSEYLNRVENDLLPILGKNRLPETGSTAGRQIELLRGLYSEIDGLRLAALDPLEQMIASLQWDGFKATQNMVALRTLETKLAGQRTELMTTLQRMSAVSAQINAQANEQIESTRRRTAWVSLLAGILGSFVALLIALLITRSITRPLQRIVNVAHDIARGDLSREIAVEHHDEVAALAAAFNTMKTAIQQVLLETNSLIAAVRDGKLETRGNAHPFSGGWRKLVESVNTLTDAFAKVNAELQEAKETLEKRVAERTMELALANRDLQVEIAERNQAEVALRQSERKFRAIFDQTFQLIGLLTHDGRMIEANQTALQFCGIEEAPAVIGRPYWETPWWAHSPELQEQIRAAVEKAGGGEFVRFEVTHPAADGSLRYLDFSIKPVVDESGKITLLIPEGRDITTHKKLEAQLLQSQKMEAVGTLAGGIAHDFNNILTAIIGYSTLLQLRMAKDDPLRNMLDEILTASERAAGLTKSLLTFSRKQSMAPQPVDLNTIVTGIEKFLHRIIGEDIHFKTIPADESLPVMADSGQIEQVLMNLATNARDAMPAGGHLTIQTERLIVIDWHSYLQPGEYAVLSVSDSGVGMDESTRQKIFEPFFTTKEMGKGTGLGLAIVYGIIKQHSGEIQVYSEPGKGTTFKIFLKRIASAGEIPEAAPFPRPAGGTATILVAEDDADVRKYMRCILEEYGYTVLEATDGEEAVRIFIENEARIQLLIFDVVMPKKNGKDAYEELIRIKGTAPPVLFTSGYTADLIHQKGVLEEDMNFISKPVSPQLLLARIDALISG